MKLSKRILGAALIGLMSTQAVAARELLVGAQCNYPPYNFREPSGELKGFDIDIATEVAKRLDASVEFVCQPFDSLISGLLAQQFDLIVSNLSITEERKQAIDFSKPYRVSTGRFVGRADAGVAPFTADGTPDPAALDGKVIGVQRATTNDNYLQAEFPGAEVTRYDTAENMLLDLQAGRVDMILAGPIKINADFLMKPEGEGYGFVGPEIDQPKYFGDGVGVALRKGNEDLLAEINGALDGMFEDGTFKEINQKYWSFSVLPAVWQ